MSKSNKTRGQFPAVIIIPAIITAVGTIVVATINAIPALIPSMMSISASQTAAALSTLSVSAAPPPAPTTNTPTFTSTIPPTDTPTLTPTPEPAPRISNYVNGDTVTQIISLMGEYRVDVHQPLWVFVHDPNTLYYAISMDPCNGQSTPKYNGKWEIRTGVGSPTSSGIFELVLTIADSNADQFIADTLKQNCKDNKYPGFAALPPNVTEVQRIKVIRQKATKPDEIYPKPPLLPDAGLPGQVSFTNISTGDLVKKEEIITGSVSGIGDKQVWVLVYTFFGRWYPQSYDPCKSVHTIANGGEWKVKSMLGGDGDRNKPFDIVVFVADSEASAFLSAKQKEWCLNNNYPGFLTIELPDGLSEKEHVRVIRK
jgi:hypothetical protein